MIRSAAGFGNTAGVTWLHPYFGRLAWKSHVDYLEQRSSVCGSRHPWYFVNTRKFLGEPLSWGNLSQLFATRCRRLGIPPPHNVHSLRHMYVNFLLHVLGLSLAQAQVLVRHVSQESTANYATTCKEMTRRSLERLARDHPAFINYPEFGSL
jgi:site-specific recombinase XerD